MKNFAIAAIAGVASAKLLRPSGITSQSIGEYTNFVGKYNRSTMDHEEFEKRVGIFIENQAYVDKVNAEAEGQGDDAVRLEMNKFGDIDAQEMEDNYMGIEPSKRIGNSGFGRRVGKGLGDHAAITVDHHADGKMTEVKDQGQCGSCWAFASNTALEGSLAISSGRAPIRLSEQQVVDCTLGNRKDSNGNIYNMGGCNGGWMAAAWRYQMSDGFMTDADYPYNSGTTRTENECGRDASKVIGKATGYTDLDSVDQLLAKLKTHPISIAIHASSRDFQLYKSGVLKKEQCNGGINHGVVVVGYTLEGDGDGDDGDNNAECKVTKWWHSCGSTSRRLSGDSKGLNKYFKVQNSWGKWWGDKGFVRFNIDEDGTGVCGMYQYAQAVDGVYQQ